MCWDRIGSRMGSLKKRGLSWIVMFPRTGESTKRNSRREVADDSRQNIFFNITSPAPGTFIIALHFKGRDKPILEMDLKIDDLLEKVS